MGSRGKTLTAVLTAAALVSGAAVAQAPAPPDWPCVQRFSPSLSGGSIFPLPEELLGLDWRGDSEVIATARQLIKTPSETESLLDSFFATNKNDNDGAKRAAKLFSAVVGLLDDKRKARIDGIRKFARAQQAFAKKIIADQAKLRKEGGDENSDLAQRVEWSIRLHRQRDESVVDLCKKIPELEGLAFQLGRAVAARLPQ